MTAPPCDASVAPSVHAWLDHTLLQLAASAGTSRADMGRITLLPHQVTGADRLRTLLARHGGALLADPVGTGKTFTALAVARQYPSALIVAPAALRPRWVAACRDADVAHAAVVSYQQLSAGRHPAGGPWPLLILDEAHHARTPTTRRYRALAALAFDAHCLLLTATPMHNRARDVTALLALFLGQAAHALDDAALASLVVRHDPNDGASSAPATRALPAIAATARHPLPAAPAVTQALAALPSPTPPADGETAAHLVALQLTRAWCSSDAALLDALRRRLVTATALEQALRAGRHPVRRDLALWLGGDDGSVQLAFAELLAPDARGAGRAPLLRQVQAHANALQALQTLVRGDAARDPQRFALLDQLCARGSPVLVFSHSAVTAHAAYRALAPRRRAALLTGRGGAIASGPVGRQAILAAFAPPTAPDATTIAPRNAPHCTVTRDQIDVLVATDVMSEGVDLQRARTIVHLDLPWTVARLEQRVGRARRYSSPHARIETHLIAPPDGAEELARTLAHLARKDQLVSHLMGPSPLLGSDRPWHSSAGDSAERAQRAPLPGVVGARERVVSALRTLRAVTASPDQPATAPAARDEPSVVSWPLAGAHARGVVALVRLDGELQLLVGSPHELTLDPSSVERHLAALIHAARQAAPLGTARGDARAANAASRDGENGEAGEADEADDVEGVGAVVDAVEEWCAARRAERIVRLPPTRDSPSHRAALHVIDALLARAPRVQRPRLAARAGEGRALIVQRRGIESERRLALAAAHPAHDPDAWFDFLTSQLRTAAGLEGESGESPRASDGSRSEAPGSAGVELLGVLVHGLPAKGRG